MKKRMSLILLICVILSVLSGCGSKNEEKSSSTSVDVIDLAARLSSDITFEDSISKLDDAVALKYYGIDAAIVKECAIYISTGATAEEIAVFEANSAEDADVIYKACEDRRNAQITSYKDYKPAELDRLDKYILQKTGNYVVFCVADDKDKAQSVIDDVLK